MIKIICEDPHKDVVKETVCKNCGVTLGYTPNEVKDGVETDYGGGRESYRYIVCPRCTHKVRV